MVSSLSLLSPAATTWMLRGLSLFVTLGGLNTLIRGIGTIPNLSAPPATKGGAEGVAEGVATARSAPLSNAIAVVDNQLRYLSTTNMATGLLGFWVSAAVAERSDVLVILGAMITLGGMARVYSGWAVGYGEAWTRRAAWTEVFGPLVIWAVGNWS